MRKLFFAATMLLSLNFLTACGFEVVDPGYRGVEISAGKVIGEPLPPGLHWYTPFIGSIHEYKVQEEVITEKEAIFTGDNQRVDITYSAVFYPEPTQVNNFYQVYGRDEENLTRKVVMPEIRGTLQSAIGKTSADKLNQQKDVLATSTFDILKKALAAKGVVLTNLQFVDTDFSDEYEKAAEAKVTATQEADKAKNETVRVQEEAKQTLLTANAEAESIRIKSAALEKNKALIELELARKWDGQLPQYMFGSGTMPMINLQKLTKNE